MANTTQQITQTPQKPRTIADMIVARKESFAAILPKHLSADRFVKVALAALTKTPGLRDCTPESLMMALVACSELGLEPNSPLGHAYLLPFEDRRRGVVDCQLIIGFKGLLAIARRSGEIGSISVRVVYERDVFEVHYGDDEKIHHAPFQPRVKYDDKGQPVGFEGPPDAGRVVAAYMIAHLKDGSVQREVMNVADILAIKARSRGAQSGKSPWTTDFAEMARKTVFRRGWKWLPQSTEMAKAASYDQDGPEDIVAKNLASASPIDVAYSMSQPLPSKADALADQLEQQANAPPQGGAQTGVQETTAPTEPAPAPTRQEVVGEVANPEQKDSPMPRAREPGED